MNQIQRGQEKERRDADDFEAGSFVSAIESEAVKFVTADVMQLLWQHPIQFVASTTSPMTTSIKWGLGKSITGLTRTREHLVEQVADPGATINHIAWRNLD